MKLALIRLFIAFFSFDGNVLVEYQGEGEEVADEPEEYPSEHIGCEMDRKVYPTQGYERKDDDSCRQRQYSKCGILQKRDHEKDQGKKVYRGYRGMTARKAVVGLHDETAYGPYPFHEEFDGLRQDYPKRCGYGKHVESVLFALCEQEYGKDHEDGKDLICIPDLCYEDHQVIQKRGSHALYKGGYCLVKDRNEVIIACNAKSDEQEADDQDQQY